MLFQEASIFSSEISLCGIELAIVIVSTVLDLDLHLSLIGSRALNCVCSPREFLTLRNEDGYWWDIRAIPP